jgi:DNA-binding SARP family transcriptional activator
VDFKILGPLEVTVGSQRLELGGTRQQIVLAALALSAGGAVSMGRLVAAVYGEYPPPTARSQVQISISALRRVFAGHGQAPAISTRGEGYVLEIGDGLLDSRRFEELTAAARAARDADRADQALACYRDALRLWRGPALEGLDSLAISAAASRLDEQRITANEDRIAVELDLGRHHELVGELTELIDEFPLRERLRGQLMLALYRCGRTAEALQVYRHARRTMIDELGIEPGGQLQRLERAILTADPSLDLLPEPVSSQPVGRHPPGLLPADIADFTDRTEQISQIRQYLIGPGLIGQGVIGQGVIGQGVIRPPEQDARQALPIVVVTGQGGIGKTSLAVHASHGLAAAFPDGQLFADLRGGGSDLVGSAHVLERFLRALGVPGAQIPDGLDERAEMYRSLLAGKKILVVLDDVAGESQATRLLPGSGTAAVIITSRNRLTGLAGASHVPVGVLGAGQSVDLLTRIAGRDQGQTQSQATTDVARHCGHLPLALRIAGARLSARPHWTMQQLADRLADETRRLDELRHGDLHVRASISLSYDSAGEPAKRLFRRLALLDMPVFSGWVSAPLLDLPLPDAQDLLDDLVIAQLIEPTGASSGAHSQYRFHELIRLFARERLIEEEPAAERMAALRRALGAFLYLVQEAVGRYNGAHYPLTFGVNATLGWPLPGQVADQIGSDPLLWFEAERAGLVAAIGQAAKAGYAELCWRLMINAADLLEARAYFADWRETADIAIEACRKAKDAHGQAAMLQCRGSLLTEQQRFDEARSDLDEAAALFRDAGDDRRYAWTIRNIAVIDRLTGRLDDAARRCEQALTLLRQSGHQMDEAYVLFQMVKVELARDQPIAALAILSDYRRLNPAHPHRRLDAQVLEQAGQTYLLTGDLTRAAEEFELALTAVLEIGDPVGESYVLRGMGVTKLRQGELDRARSMLQRALELAGRVGDGLAEGHALLALTELALADGHPGQAVVLGQKAVGTYQRIGARLYETQARSLLGNAHTALGDSIAADRGRRFDDR